MICIRHELTDLNLRRLPLFGSDCDFHAGSRGSGGGGLLPLDACNGCCLDEAAGAQQTATWVFWFNEQFCTHYLYTATPQVEGRGFPKRALLTFARVGEGRETASGAWAKRDRWLQPAHSRVVLLQSSGDSAFLMRRD